MVELRIVSSSTTFYLTREPAMPVIQLTASAVGGTVPAGTQFLWSFALDYPGFIAVPRSLVRNGRARNHPAFRPISGNPVTVPFAVVTGGRLTATVIATIAGREVRASRNDILIGGTNPTHDDLLRVVPERLMRQLIQQESGGAHFNDGRGGLPLQAINPNWSQDNLRGVGLGQLTVPPPSDEETWNWRSNAAALRSRFRGKRAPGATLHSRIMASARFQAEARALNDWRRAEGLPPLSVTLPALNADQLDREGLRAYNGFGRKVTGQYLDYIHEYEPETTRLTSSNRRDQAGRPLTSPLVPVVDASGRGSWRQISGAERVARSGGRAPGDPDYVSNVLRKPG